MQMKDTYRSTLILLNSVADAILLEIWHLPSGREITHDYDHWSAVSCLCFRVISFWALRTDHRPAHLAWHLIFGMILPRCFLLLNTIADERYLGFSHNSLTEHVHKRKIKGYGCGRTGGWRCGGCKDASRIHRAARLARCWLQAC